MKYDKRPIFYCGSMRDYICLPCIKNRNIPGVNIFEDLFLNSTGLGFTCRDCGYVDRKPNTQDMDFEKIIAMYREFEFEEDFKTTEDVYPRDIWGAAYRKAKKLFSNNKDKPLGHYIIKESPHNDATDVTKNLTEESHNVIPFDSKIIQKRKENTGMDDFQVAAKKHYDDLGKRKKEIEEELIPLKKYLTNVGVLKKARRGRKKEVQESLPQ